MREGPDIAHIANLVGDPARANMLTALVGGTALTASELAQEAGVMLPTASSHLAKLTAGGLLKLTVQGRHRYFALAGPHIAAMLESIMGVAATVGPQRVRPGPRDKPMREARVCYDHLAGDLAVAMFDGLLAKGVLVRTDDAVRLGDLAQPFFASFGIDTVGVVKAAPPGLPCLPRLERAAIAPLRRAGRRHPRQGVCRKMGAPRKRRTRGDVLAERPAGICKHVPGRAGAAAAGTAKGDCRRPGITRTSRYGPAKRLLCHI